MNTDVAVAKTLLQAGVATFRTDEPFRLTSGLLSPVYLDHRVLISQPVERKKIAQALEALIRANYTSIDAVAGTAMGGIPWTAWIASQFNIPMVYVRDRAKRHGQKNRVEGVLAPGANAILIADLVLTGSSVLNCLGAIHRVGANPLAVFGIFTSGTRVAAEGFAEAGVPLHTLTNLSTLIDTAARSGVIGADTQSIVLEWAADPAGWSKKREAT